MLLVIQTRLACCHGVTRDLYTLNCFCQEFASRPHFPTADLQLATMTRTMDEREWALLLGKHSSQTNNGQLLDAIITGHYRDALTSQAAVALFGSDLQVDGNEALIKYIDSIGMLVHISLSPELPNSP